MRGALILWLALSAWGCADGDSTASVATTLMVTCAGCSNTPLDLANADGDSSSLGEISVSCFVDPVAERFTAGFSIDASSGPISLQMTDVPLQEIDGLILTGPGQVELRDGPIVGRGTMGRDTIRVFNVELGVDAGGSGFIDGEVAGGIEFEGGGGEKISVFTHLGRYEWLPIRFDGCATP